MSAFSVADIAAAGIGLDVAGAIILARGLYTSPAQRARRLIAAQNSFAALRVQEAESHADAVVGGAALIFGVFVQTIAYRTNRWRSAGVLGRRRRH
jgi:hypothetical protein